MDDFERMRRHHDKWGHPEWTETLDLMLLDERLAIATSLHGREAALKAHSFIGRMGRREVVCRVTITTFDLHKEKEYRVIPADMESFDELCAQMRAATEGEAEVSIVPKEEYDVFMNEQTSDKGLTEWAGASPAQLL